jgi:transposase
MMRITTDQPQQQSAAAAPSHDATVFVAMELSASQWLVAANIPGSNKISKRAVPAWGVDALLGVLKRWRVQAEKREGRPVKVIVIHEAGRDGFSVHRLLEEAGMESWVVDPASIAVDRRKRRVKTDRIDVEKLLQTLMAWVRGERLVCSMVRPPTVVQEDARRLSRERERLKKERDQHVVRVKSLLALHGIAGYEPLRRDRRARLEALRTPTGRLLPLRAKTEIVRELARLEIVAAQLAEVEKERDTAITSSDDGGAPLQRLRAIGPEFASVLTLEAFFRNFSNRRQVAAYSGLVPAPWQSGAINRDQGISKAGNPRLRRVMIEAAWTWLRYQPDSALSRWFRARVGDVKGRLRRIMITALARKLLVALWRYATQGVIPEGAVFKA